MKKYLSIFEDFIFVFLLFAQNFALIIVNGTGISALVIFLLYIFVVNKMYRYSFIKYIKLSLVFFIICIIEFLVNRYYNLSRVIRVEMLLFISYVVYYYLKSKTKLEVVRLYEYLHKFGLAIGIYGIYQFIGVYLKLPMFLNILQNNPSYSGKKGLYYNYVGWVTSPRIYTLFSEPSYYAIFLVFLILLLFICNNLKYRYLYLAIYIINLVLTYSRAGWVVLLMLAAGFIGFKLCERFKNRLYYNIIYYITLVLPLVSIAALYIADKVIFHDLSSATRSSSAVYYFVHSFDSIKYIVFGHGAGYIQTNYNYKVLSPIHVEAFAHNGYVEILFEYGIIVLGVVIYYLTRLSSKIKDGNLRILFTILVISINIFESYYSIESMIAIMTLLYYACKYSKGIVNNDWLKLSFLK